MVALEEMGHLMDNDVLQVLRVFLSEFEVEPDVASLAVAGARRVQKPGRVR